MFSSSSHVSMTPTVILIFAAVEGASMNMDVQGSLL